MRTAWSTGSHGVWLAQREVGWDSSFVFLLLSCIDGYEKSIDGYKNSLVRLKPACFWIMYPILGDLLGGFRYIKQYLVAYKRKYLRALLFGEDRR